MNGDLHHNLLERETGRLWQAEFRFCTRRWRFDYALPACKIAVEIEGGVWTKGRHTRGKGYIGDMEKYNIAQLLGWRVFRFTPDQTTRMIATVKEVCK